jgi:cytochrome P450
MWRLCTQDTEIEGTKIPAGSMCMVRFAAANRDPAQFPDPEDFDVGRANAAEHLAFGMGIHHCIGAALARKEMNVAFRTLLSRLDGFALDAKAKAPRHKPNILLWGFDSLPITYRRRSS